MSSRRWAAHSNVTPPHAELRNPRQALQLINSLRGPAQATRHDALLEEACRFWPKDISLAMRRVRVLCQRQEFWEAISVLVDASAADPGSARLRYELAKVYRKVNMDDAAIRVLEEALAIRPQSLEIIRALAGALHWLDRCAEAEPYYVRIVAMTPNAYGWKLELAHIYTRLGRLNDCERVLLEIRAAAANHMDAAEHLAVAFMMMGRYNEAEQLLRDAIAKYDAVLFNRILGALLVDTGRYGEAEPILRAVRERQPTDALVLTKLATICVHSNRPQEAWDLAVKALSPDQVQAAEILKALLLPNLIEPVAQRVRETLLTGAIDQNAAATPDPPSHPGSRTSIH